MSRYWLLIVLEPLVRIDQSVVAFVAHHRSLRLAEMQLRNNTTTLFLVVRVFR